MVACSLLPQRHITNSMKPFIVDFAPHVKNGSPSASDADMASIGKTLVDGFRSCGVVYVKNAGLALDKMTQALDVVGQFFELPPEAKSPYRLSRNLLINGYLGMAAGWLGRDVGQTRDSREAYHFCMFGKQGLSDVDPDKEVPGFSEAIRLAGRPFVPLSKWLLQCLALGMGLEKGTFDAYMEHAHEGATPGSNTSMSIVAVHPPIDDSEDLTNLARCGQHKDFTLLSWDLIDSVGGLQMQKDGVWLDVPSVPDTVGLFAGEALEILLANKIPALVHQVVVTDREMARKKRKVFLFFMRADAHAIVKPLDGSDEISPTSEAQAVNEYYKKVAVLSV